MKIAVNNINTYTWIKPKNTSNIACNIGVTIGVIIVPKGIEKITILRAVHKYKDSREQFEKRTHKRLIDINNPSKETIEALAHLDLPSGVDIQIKK